MHAAPPEIETKRGKPENTDAEAHLADFVEIGAGEALGGIGHRVEAHRGVLRAERSRVSTMR
eukprot:1052769-Rhodomonas_salina.1